MNPAGLTGLALCPKGLVTQPGITCEPVGWSNMLGGLFRNPGVAPGELAGPVRSYSSYGISLQCGYKKMVDGKNAGSSHENIGNQETVDAPCKVCCRVHTET